MRIIGGSARGRPLVGPRGRTTRPAFDRLREAIFASLGAHVEDARVLDLFAGAGAFGLEALSRGAMSCLFVERDRAALEALDRNIASLHFGIRSRVLRGDALKQPRPGDVDAPFDLIFVDPPFPLFDESGTAEGVVARVRSLVSAPYASEGTRLLLRVPANARTTLPFSDARRRRYGRSEVVWIEPPAEESEPRDSE